MLWICQDINLGMNERAPRQSSIKQVEKEGEPFIGCNKIKGQEEEEEEEKKKRAEHKY
jgi:hypothetical protein